MNNKVKLGLILAVIITLVVLFFVFDLAQYFQTDKLLMFRSYMQGLGALGLVIYFGLWLVLAVSCLQIFPLKLLAGLIYGPILGSFLAIIGAICGVAIDFLISRYFLKDTIMSVFKKNGIYKKIIHGVDKNGANFLILTRLVFIFPYGLQNYFYGLSSIKFRTYMIISAVTMLPVTIVYTYLASDIIANGLGIRTLVILTISASIIMALTYTVKYFAKKKGIEI